jgi:hypothetical protein
MTQAYKETLMANSTGNNAVCIKTKADFNDAAHWDGLAEIHLSRFNLPKWEIPCSPDQMEIWADRVGISKSDCLKYWNTDFADFIVLNPDWPLRAFIGLLLEQADMEK